MSVRCEKCKEETRVITGKMKGDVYVRTHKCMKCGHKFKTAEITQDEYNGYIDMSNGIANIMRRYLLNRENTNKE